VIGLAATVGLPTGSSDPFAVRRAVLGLLAVFRRHAVLAPVPLTDALRMAAALQPVPVSEDVLAGSAEFFTRRLEQLLSEEGQPVDRVRAVLPHAAGPHLVDRLLEQLAKLIEQPTFRQLTEALQRARRIVPAGTPGGYDPALLIDPAEIALHEALAGVRAEVGDSLDLERFTEVAGRIVQPVNRFFEDVFVMVDDVDLRAARLGLLATVRDVGGAVLDWAQLRM
jgi:glycyl-tRNA synthetase